ncbi:hypothetical protein V525_17275 [Gordonia alkanivorans CGMCC 6845]|uniref:Uncharacterized protein n=1 Tax=Gordonia alkanivorans CGMCC 6845 TaxID=1423140 RepID=W9DGT4_9ACTN|nr:hypothetical protein V525_17275 [Gordonia alkanivorans CGMCC 6845]
MPEEDCAPAVQRGGLQLNLVHAGGVEILCRGLLGVDDRDVDYSSLATMANSPLQQDLVKIGIRYANVFARCTHIDFD